MKVSTQDHVNVGLVLQHHVMEDLKRELAELQKESAMLENLRSLFALNRLGHPARQRGNRMDRLPPDDRHDTLRALAQLDHLPARLQTDFADHAQNIALRRGCIRSDHKVRPAQGIEVQGMIPNKKRGVQ